MLTYRPVPHPAANITGVNINSTRGPTNPFPVRAALSRSDPFPPDWIRQPLGKPRFWCKTQYKFLYSKFEVKGSRWDRFLMGKRGEKIYERLNNCGIVSHWKFRWLDADPDYEFYFEGHLGVFTKNCIERNLQFSGAPNNGLCKGTG